MKPLIAVVVIGLPILLAGRTARAETTLMENDQTVAIDCAKDPEVSLLGNHLTVSLTGTCTRVSIAGNHATLTGSAISVSVTGNHNTVTLAAADDVSIPGNENTVSVKKAIKRKTPKVSSIGNRNKIN